MALEIPKRKRGRPPKVPIQVAVALEFPWSHLTEAAASELELGYKILKEILSIPKISALSDKPDETLFGLHNYYDVIDHPMWFQEISRKFANEEYKELKEVIADLKLVLENCYRFWGSKHKFIKQAFRVEKLLDRHMKEFPENIKIMCSTTHLNENSTSSSNSDSGFLLEAYNSKILQTIDKTVTLPPKEVEELKKWELDFLLEKVSQREICLTPELAEIGYFLKLTSDTLCLQDVTQYEIERMLITSKESSTLASIMTCFLCPTAMRGTLYFKPLMSYDVWVSLLSKKMDNWYNSYSKYNNRLQVFLKHGVEPSFWDTVGLTNPLTNTDFHLLSFHKKVYILKALCSSIFQSNKKIEDNFNSVEESTLRVEPLFEDSHYNYFNMFLPEIRIYRVSKIEIDTEETVKAMLPDYVIPPKGESETPSLKCSRKQKFYLISFDRPSCETLLKTFTKRKKSVKMIRKILNEEDSESRSLMGLKALYVQWKRGQDQNSSIFFEKSFNYWIKKASMGLNGEIEPVNNELELPHTLGKRVLKKTITVKEIESSSNDDEKGSEESVSDWEDGNVRRSKRIKKAGKTPRFFDKKFMSQFEFGKDFNRRPTVQPLNTLRVPRSLPPRRKLSLINAAVENANFVTDSSSALTIDMSRTAEAWEPVYLEGKPESSWTAEPSSSRIVNENGLSLLELSPYRPAPPPVPRLTVPSSIQNFVDQFETTGSVLYLPSRTDQVEIPLSQS